LVILGHIIDELGLGDASLGEDLFLYGILAIDGDVLSWTEVI
jgi:hypothetical protein